MSGEANNTDAGDSSPSSTKPRSWPKALAVAGVVGLGVFILKESGGTLSEQAQPVVTKAVHTTAKALGVPPFKIVINADPTRLRPGEVTRVTADVVDANLKLIPVTLTIDCGKLEPIGPGRLHLGGVETSEKSEFVQCRATSPGQVKVVATADNATMNIHIEPAKVVVDALSTEALYRGRPTNHNLSGTWQCHRAGQHGVLELNHVRGKVTGRYHEPEVTYQAGGVADGGKLFVTMTRNGKPAFSFNADVGGNGDNLELSTSDDETTKMLCVSGGASM